MTSVEKQPLVLDARAYGELADLLSALGYEPKAAVTNLHPADEDVDLSVADAPAGTPGEALPVYDRVALVDGSLTAAVNSVCSQMLHPSSSAMTQATGGESSTCKVDPEWPDYLKQLRENIEGRRGNEEHQDGEQQQYPLLRVPHGSSSEFSLMVPQVENIFFPTLTLGEEQRQPQSPNRGSGEPLTVDKLINVLFPNSSGASSGGPLATSQHLQLQAAIASAADTAADVLSGNCPGRGVNAELNPFSSDACGAWLKLKTPMSHAAAVAGLTTRAEVLLHYLQPFLQLLMSCLGPRRRSEEAGASTAIDEGKIQVQDQMVTVIARLVDTFLRAVERKVLPSAYTNPQASLTWFRELQWLQLLISSAIVNSSAAVSQLEEEVEQCTLVAAEFLDQAVTSYIDELQSIASTRRSSHWINRVILFKKQWLAALGCTAPTSAGGGASGSQPGGAVVEAMSLNNVKPKVEILELYFGTVVDGSLASINEALIELLVQSSGGTEGVEEEEAQRKRTAGLLQFASALRDQLPRELHDSYQTAAAEDRRGDAPETPSLPQHQLAAMVNLSTMGNLLTQMSPPSPH